MSASREKKLRKLVQTEGNQKQTSIEGGTWQRTTAIIVCLLVALLVFFFIMVGSGIPQRLYTAATIGSERINVAEYNFNLYSNAINYVTYMSNYGYSNDDIGLNLDENLDDQEFSGSTTGSETWGSYLRDQTNSSLQETIALYLDALANGFTLTDDLRAKIDTSIQNIKDYCTENNLTLSRYLSSNYGRGVNENVVRSSLEKSNLADYYAEQKKNSYKYTDDELKNYYESNKTDFDFVNYRSFVVSGEPEAKTDASGKEVEATDEEKKTAMAAAKKSADAMLAEVTDEASFGKLAIKYASDTDKATYADPDSTLEKAVSASYLTEDMRTWMFDAARKTGDKAVIESDTYYTVVYMIKRYRDDQNTINVRHILIKPEVSNGATASEAELAAAKKEAETLYEQWKSGGATEDSFAELAKANSDDSGSSSDGGLYENVYAGQMLPEFNDWCFNTTRKAGDTGIVKTDSGYHIMYFVSYSEPHWKLQVKETMSSNAYNDYLTEIEKKYTLNENSFGISLTGSK